jgi:uncharacterized protein (DUF1697 family)
MRWVVLLRAVNLGGRNKVPMAELRALLEDAGYGNVRTYIASGNIILDAPNKRAALAGELEGLVAAAFKVETTAIIRTPKELATVVAAHPFGKDTSKSHVVFLTGKPARKAVADLAAADHSPDEALLVGSDVYVRYPAGVQGSQLTAARLERLIGVSGTARNWRTVAALAELAAEA